MLLRRILVALGFQQLQSPYELRPRQPGLDNLVNESALGGNVRRSEFLTELLGTIPAFFFRVLGLRDLPAVQDIHRAFGSHNGDLGRWISEVYIRPNVL